MSKKYLHAGHRERMRERFEKDNFSFQNFRDHEALEVLLYFCYPQLNTNEIAHELLDSFKKLENVIDAPIDDLCGVEKVSWKAASHMKFYGELLKRIQKDEYFRTCRLSEASEVRRYLLRTFPYETFEPDEEAEKIIVIHVTPEHILPRFSIVYSSDFPSADCLRRSDVLFREKYINFATVHIVSDIKNAASDDERRFISSVMSVKNEMSDMLGHFVMDHSGVEVVRPETADPDNGLK